MKTILNPKTTIKGTSTERANITPNLGDDGHRFYETDTTNIYEAHGGSWQAAGGSKGDTGTAGAKGDTGTGGTKGDTGTTGPQGDTGTQGTKGDTGSGTKGDTGIAGAQGDTGTAGGQGDTGTAGAKGDTGTAGSQGDTGDQGDTGVGISSVRLFKNYYSSGQGFGSTEDLYMGGYYSASATSFAASQASATTTWGTASDSVGAHVFIVASGAGSAASGQVGVRVQGTSIADDGTRTTSDTEVLDADITTLTANEYLETSKRWLGQVTVGLYIVSGTPATYSLSFNYGFCLYDNWDSTDVTIQSIMAHGMANASETAFEIELIHHKTTGWTYAASGFDPVQSANVLESLSGDHSTDDNAFASKANFAWRHTGISQAIDGTGAEGFLVRAQHAVNNGIHHIEVQIGVDV
jgi:hypothetical protein